VLRGRGRLLEKMVGARMTPMGSTTIEVREKPRVSPRSAQEVWVTADGRQMTIGEMDEAHAKYALALIMRNLRAGKLAAVDPLTNRLKVFRFMPNYAGVVKDDWEDSFWRNEVAYGNN
jgi:hypothetical protein